MTQLSLNAIVLHWFNALGIPHDYGQRHQLSLCEESKTLVPIGHDVFERPQSMAPVAASAWQMMQASAEQDGVVLQVVSAFRSIEYQALLIQKKLDKGQLIEEILKVSAAPGFSEHHTGQALDLTTPDCPPLEEEFAETDAYRWLKTNALEFGFVESFGKNNPHGLIWEPWHWCYRPFLISA